MQILLTNLNIIFRKDNSMSQFESTALALD